MEDNDESKKEKFERTRFIYQSFNFPEELDFILDLFQQQCAKEFAIAQIPNHSNKCKSVGIRRLIFKKLLDSQPDNEGMKRAISNFIQKENEYHNRIITNYRKKKK